MAAESGNSRVISWEINARGGPEWAAIDLPNGSTLELEEGSATQVVHVMLTKGGVQIWDNGKRVINEMTTEQTSRIVDATSPTES